VLGVRVGQDNAGRQKEAIPLWLIFLRKTNQRQKLGNGDGGDEPPTLHPLIKGLVDSLPPAGSDWSNED
jgi:hypothetical protein